MKPIAIITPIVGLLWPTLAFAAGGEAAQGSWLALIFYTINFVLFLWICRYYGGSTITDFFHDRARTIRENRNRAEHAFREAQALANQAARQLEWLDADKARIAAELGDETAYQVERIREAAREAANRLRRDTDLTTAALREGAQRRLRQTMAEGAGRQARELVKLNFRAGDQERLLEDFIERVGDEAAR
jgi:F-type H+-transporting ATPase subunit b